MKIKPNKCFKAYNMGTLEEHESYSIEQGTPWHHENYNGLKMHSDDLDRSMKSQSSAVNQKLSDE